MSESFSFLLLTVSAQQREEPACGRIPPPPGLFRVKSPNKSDSGELLQGDRPILAKK